MGDTRFSLTYYDAPEAGRLALLTIDNGEDHTRPTFLGLAALDSLEAALDALEDDGDVRGLLVTGKPFIFAAGADLNAFVGVAPEQARAGVLRGHGLFGRLRALPFPTLAAINGVCLGGGLELALHCDYRTLAGSVGAIGFPEVFLSILPGWGGSQLAPRLIGGPNALRVVVTNPLDRNRTLRAAQAYELGLADRLLDPVDFLDRSVVLLADLVTGAERIERPDPATEGLDEALAAVRATADAKVHGATPAPYRAIDLVEHAARGGDLDEGLAMEADAIAELLPARQAQASLYSFDLTQRRVRRQPGRPDAPPRQVRRAAVVGAGLMGAQLGALALVRLEVPLVVKDVDEGVLAGARTHIEGEVDRRVARGRLPEPKARFLKSIVTYTTDDAALAGCDLVVEAVPERLELKQKVFAAVEEAVDPGCVLATNTSALSVTAMAEALRHPERVVGLHFFTPVAVLPLVEVVRGAETGDEALATAFEVAGKLRKSAVACADSPGFVVNRLAVRFMGSCIAAVDEGAEFPAVDTAVKELGLPMGPFELLGLSGPGVVAHVARILHDAFPDRFPVSANLQMVADVGLPGVYDWSGGTPEPYPQVREAWETQPSAQPPSAEEIRTGALEAVADEIAHLLDEGVVADARDVDTCLLLGLGWPFFTGGICFHLDATGVSERVAGRRLLG